MTVDGPTSPVSSVDAVFAVGPRGNGQRGTNGDANTSTSVPHDDRRVAMTPLAVEVDPSKANGTDPENAQGNSPAKSSEAESQTAPSEVVAESLKQECTHRDSEETGSKTHDSHLRICIFCRTHQIQAFEEEIARLKQLQKSHQGDEKEATAREEEEQKRLREEDCEREAKLLKIQNEKYREVKSWQNGSLGNAPVLLLTSDGASYGIRRSAGTSFELRRQPSAHHNQNELSGGQREAYIPFRLVINSSELFEILSKITGRGIPVTYPVHVRPFKYLLFHEEQIRNALSQIQKLCETEPDQTQTHDSASEPGVATKSSKSSPAKDDESSTIETKETEKSNAEFMGVKATPRARDLLKCLANFMDDEMRDILDLQKQIADRTLQDISFEYLYHLFKPGDLILAEPGSSPKERRAYRVLFVTGGRPNIDKDGKGPGDNKFESKIGDTLSPGFLGKATKMTPVIVDCFYVDSDGEKYGAIPKRFVFPEFRGTRVISDLEAYPAEFDPHYGEIKDVLIARGKEFARCASGTHRQYKGKTLSDKLADKLARTETLETFEIDCECIIDQKGALERYEPTWRDEDYHGITSRNKLGFGGGVIATPTDPINGETFDVQVEQDNVCFTDMYDDLAFDLDRRTAFVNSTLLLDETKDPGDDHYILLPTRIYGYALHHRHWYALHVQNLSDVRSQQQASQLDSAFDDLVLPDKHKKTIRALVKYQTRGFQDIARVDKNGGTSSEVATSLDLIRGKGRGLIILLHGAPGVGKTSTAESVAVQLKRPLLPITCGDLGISADAVERRLEDFFRLAARWGCVVLLDEADVFLAKRVTGDLERNALVSIFLRQLEYYSGVLILTTNRVGEFDEAFVSRIHMKLYFPVLDQKSTMEIWDMNIRRIKDNVDIDVDVKEDGIRDFADKFWHNNIGKQGRQWNGRQIKNAFQTAVALAYYEWEDAKSTGKGKARPVLKKSNFKDVAATSIHFDRYIDQLYGAKSAGAMAELAQTSRLRDDSGLFELQSTSSSASRANKLGVPASSRRQQRSMLSGSPGGTNDSQTAYIADLERQLAAQSEKKSQTILTPQSDFSRSISDRLGVQDDADSDSDDSNDDD